MELPKYFTDNFNSISLDYLKFTFVQSEKFLIELVRTGENITKKAHAILAIAVTILTITLGAVFGFKVEGQEIIIATIVLSAFSLIAIILLVKPLWSYNTYVIGTPPKSLLQEEFVSKFSDESNILKNLYLNEILDYQSRITFNECINRQRTKYVDISMFLLVGSPLLSWGAGFIYVTF